MKEMGFNVDKPTIREDNQPAIHLAKIENSKRTKHVDYCGHQVSFY